jgi:uncharacterized membrane protein
MYPNLQAAEAALKRLTDTNFPINQISIVTHDIETTKHYGFMTDGDLAAAKGVASGAWVGGVIGLLVGATFIWVPGFAPLFVAGPFAISLIGGLEGMAVGAAAGGLLSALLSLGVSKEQMLNQEEVVKGSEYLLVASGDESQVIEARTILGGLIDQQMHPIDAGKVVKS